MYIELNKSFLEQNKDESEKDDILLYTKLIDSFDLIEVKEDCIEVNIKNELGSFTAIIPLDLYALGKIMTILIKKMNRFKTMIESMNLTKTSEQIVNEKLRVRS